MDTGISINASPDMKTYAELADRVLEIMTTRADQATIQMGLRVLEGAITSAPNISVSNNMVTNKTIHETTYAPRSEPDETKGENQDDDEDKDHVE